MVKAKMLQFLDKAQKNPCIATASKRFLLKITTSSTISFFLHILAKKLDFCILISVAFFFATKKKIHGGSSAHFKYLYTRLSKYLYN